MYQISFFLNLGPIIQYLLVKVKLTLLLNIAHIKNVNRTWNNGATHVVIVASICRESLLMFFCAYNGLIPFKNNLFFLKGVTPHGLSEKKFLFYFFQKVKKIYINMLLYSFYDDIINM